MDKKIKIGDLKYPTCGKRPVRVTYMTWKGYDPDAYHIIVEIIESWNYEYTGSSWVSSSTRQDLIGKSFRKKFATFKAAERWAKNIILKNFPSKTHETTIKDIT